MAIKIEETYCKNNSFDALYRRYVFKVAEDLLTRKHELDGVSVTLSKPPKKTTSSTRHKLREIDSNRPSLPPERPGASSGASSSQALAMRTVIVEDTEPGSSEAPQRPHTSRDLTSKVRMTGLPFGMDPDELKTLLYEKFREVKVYDVIISQNTAIILCQSALGMPCCLSDNNISS